MIEKISNNICSPFHVGETFSIHHTALIILFFGWDSHSVYCLIDNPLIPRSNQSCESRARRALLHKPGSPYLRCACRAPSPSVPVQRGSPSAALYRPPEPRLGNASPGARIRCPGPFGGQQPRAGPRWTRQRGCPLCSTPQFRAARLLPH